MSAAEGAQDNGDGYSIFGITMDNNVATVEYAALEDCTLLVSVYDEETGQMAGSGNVEISAEYYSAEVTVEVPIMPQYFIVKAYMVDNTNMKPLRPVYENTMYTKDMQELMAATVDDFDSERVLNLDGDKTTNFLVYGENTIRIAGDGDTNVVTGQGEDSDIYTVENISEDIKGLKTGDIVAIGRDANVTILKVKKITIEGTKATIVEDDVELEEVFECIKIENKANSKNAIIDESACGEGVTYLGKVEEQPEVLSAGDSGASVYLSGTYDEFTPLVDPEGGFSLEGGAKFACEWEKKSWDDTLSGKISGEISIGITIELKFYLTKKKQMLEFYTGKTLGVNLKVEGAWEKTIMELTEIVLPAIPGINVALIPKIVIKVGGSVELGAMLSGKVGIKYDSTAPQPIELVRKFGLDNLEASVNATIGIGVAFEPAINILSSKIAQVGLEFEAMIEGKVKVSTNFGSEHACALCLSANLGVTAKLEPKIKLLDVPVSLTLSLTIAKIDLGTCYYSFTFKKFGWGECPYKRVETYQTTIFARNKERRPLYGVSITVEGTTAAGETFKETQVTDLWGEVNINIPEGTNYTIVGSKDNYKDSSRTLLTWDGSQRVADLVLYDICEIVSDAFVLKEGVEISENTYKNTFLKKVIIEDDKYVTNGKVFEGAEIEEVVIKSGATRIPDYLFAGSTIKKIEIPDNIMVIGEEAFFKTSLPEDFKIGKGVKLIKTRAFANSQLKLGQLVIDESLNIGREAFDAVKIGEVLVNSYIGVNAQGAFAEGRSSIQRVTIADNVMKIPKGLFRETTIHEITIPESVEIIGESAFWGARLPDSFQLGKGVKKIESSAFENAGLPKNFQIGNGVTEIGDRAFYGSGIKQVSIGKGQSVGGLAFCMTRLNEVILDYDASLIDIYVFTASTIDKVSISEGVTQIPMGMFAESKINEIDLPDSVTEIDEFAFLLASLPEGFEIGQHILTFGNGAFDRSNVKVNKVIIDEERNIGNAAFNGVTIKEVIINGDKKVQVNNPFSGATIHKVTITENVTEIPSKMLGEAAIYNIAIPANIVRIGDYAFASAQLPPTFSVPNSVQIGKDAFKDATYNCVPTNTYHSAEGGKNIDLQVPDILEKMNYEVYGDMPTVTRRTTTLTGLRPNDTYNFYVVKANYEFMSMDEIMAPKNVLYVTQVKTDEKGTATINYLPREEYDSPMEFAKCMSRYDISASTVRIDPIQATGQKISVLPKVIYQGQELAEYGDYDVKGDFLVKDAGTYTITIVGKGDYCGSKKANYKVVTVEEMQQNPFADVKESGWEYNFAKFVYLNGLMNGKGKDENGLIRFDPSNYMTRAEFVQTLYNKEGKEEVAYTSKFTDVPDGQWYTDAILWAAEKGIIAGKGEIFDVSGKITREEMATILYKYATNYKGYETAGRAEFTGYTDAATISGWATENMKWALHYGIMKGKKEALAPKDNATRAECATMLSNFMKAYE